MNQQLPEIRNNTHSLGRRSNSQNIKIDRRYEKLENLKGVHDQLRKRSARDKIQYEELLDLCKTKVRKNYDHLYESQQINREQIIKEIRQLQKKKTTQNQIKFLFKQSQKQKQTHDKLLNQIKLKQKILTKVTSANQQKQIYKKECSIKFEHDQLIAKAKQRKENQNYLEKLNSMIDYQFAVLNNMRENRAYQLTIQRLRYQYSYKKLNELKQRISSNQLSTNLKQRKLQYLNSKINKMKQIMLTDFNPGKLDQNFKVLMQQQISQFQGKIALQQIFKHQKQLAQQKQKQQQQQRLLRNQIIKKNQQQEIYQRKLTQLELEKELTIQKEKESLIRKRIGVPSVKSLIPQKNKQFTKKQNLIAIKQSLQCQKEKLKKQIQNLQNPYIFGQDVARQSYDQQQLNKVLQKQHKLQENNKKFSNLLDKTCLLVTRLQFQLGMSVQIKREKVADELSAISNRLQSLKHSQNKNKQTPIFKLNPTLMQQMFSQQKQEQEN